MNQVTFTDRFYEKKVFIYYNYHIKFESVKCRNNYLFVFCTSYNYFLPI